MNDTPPLTHNNHRKIPSKGPKSMGFLNITIHKQLLNEEYQQKKYNIRKSQAERYQDQQSPLKRPLPPDAGTGAFKLSQPRCTSLSSQDAEHLDRARKDRRGKGTNRKENSYSHNTPTLKTMNK